MSETRAIPGSAAIVRRSDCMGSSIYTAYEPSVGGYASTSHYSLTSHDGMVYGAVHCRRPAANIDALPPFSDERSAAFKAFYQTNQAEAITMILLAFPELMTSGRVSGGEILADYERAEKGDGE